MCAALHHAALVDNVNHVCFLDGAKPMGDRDGGAPARGRVEGHLHDVFRLRVERRRGFVEEEDFRVTKERARNGDALFLAAGEEGSFGAYDGGKALTGKGLAFTK